MQNQDLIRYCGVLIGNVFDTAKNKHKPIQQIEKNKTKKHYKRTLTKTQYLRAPFQLLVV